MGAEVNRSGPASRTYTGFAWEFLRRNPEYRIAFERSRTSSNAPTQLDRDSSYIRVKKPSKAAQKWGLQSFADPDLSYMDAHVFWSHTAFTRALPIDFERITSSNLADKSIRFSDIMCTRQHLIRADGTRETVLKSPEFWIQLYGCPPSPTKENSRIIIQINGGDGLRKRLEALNILAELRDTKTLKLIEASPQQMFKNLQFYLQILDLKPLGMSYRDMSALIIGKERTLSDWDGDGCSLKSKMVRGAARAIKLMETDYLQLLRR